MRGSGRDRPELDGPVHQVMLNRLGEELTTAVGLDALDWEWHLLNEALQEGEGVGCRGAAVNAEHLVAAAIVDCRGLIDARPDFADVHLGSSNDTGSRRPRPCARASFRP